MWDKSKKTDLLQILIPDKRRPKVRFFGNFKNECGKKLRNTFVSTSFGPLMDSVAVQLWNLFLSLIGIFQFHRYLLIPTAMFNQMLHELVSLFLQ